MRNRLNLNENLYGRLYNWKFESALKYLKGESKEVKKTVRELARKYGNIGWIYESELAEEIARRVFDLGVEEDE